jgi:hypothetical protein
MIWVPTFVNSVQNTKLKHETSNLWSDGSYWQLHDCLNALIIHFSLFWRHCSISHSFCFFEGMWCFCAAKL